MSVHLKAGNNTGTNLEIVPTTTKKIQSKVKHPQNVINQTLLHIHYQREQKIELKYFQKANYQVRGNTSRKLLVSMSCLHRISGFNHTFRYE